LVNETVLSRRTLLHGVVLMLGWPVVSARSVSGRPAGASVKPGRKGKMTVVDYPNSYLFFTTKRRTNTARLLVEARCELIDEAKGASEEFFFFASCKSEHTYAPRKLFQDPNYDFCGIFSAKDFALIRTPALYEQDMNTVDAVATGFEGLEMQIRRTDRARVLDSIDAIVKATLEGRPLVGRTEIADEERRLRAVLEYPIKTMNVNGETKMFQVDTGPIPFPDWTATGERAIHRMRPAYVAYNRFDLAEFILQVPTPVSREGREVGKVLHYSAIRELPAKNSVLVVNS
jgi:hypothetical protein